MKTLRHINIVIWLLALSLVGSSCVPKLAGGYLSDYRDAQTAFNQAAQAENQLRNNPGAGIALSPETSYGTARTFIMKAMGTGEAQNVSKLAADGLLLGAYSIKAMSEWKLGRYSDALATSKDAQLTFANDQSVQQQRDYIVLGIIEPLIYNDSIATYIQQLPVRQGQQSLNIVDQAYLSQLEKAHQIVKEKRARLPEDHPLQTYLLISELSIGKNWKNLYAKVYERLREGRSADAPTWKQGGETTKKTLNMHLADALVQLAAIIGDKHPFYIQWQQAHPDVIIGDK